jgi:hypothetical protein
MTTTHTPTQESSQLGYGIEASRDPEVILAAVTQRNRDLLGSCSGDLDYVNRRLAEMAAGTAWAASESISGFTPILFKTRAHHIVATGAWPFLEDRFRQMQQELEENKGKRGARKSLTLHLAASDGRWFTISAPGGEVAMGLPGEKKAKPVWRYELRFLWHHDRLVLTGDAGANAKRRWGQVFLAPATELESYRTEEPQPDGRVLLRSACRDVPSRITWDLIEALCQAACDLSPDSLAEFGKLTGICAVCGRSLTDKLSKERGIGPVCWEQVMEVSRNA